ncbi:MAG: ROK family protein, partial [Clostridia bacterium]
MKIGIDLGGMSVKAGVIGKDYKILYKESITTDVENGAKKLAADIIELVKRIMAKFPNETTSSIGIGVPGDVNKYTKRVVYCNNIPIADFDLRGAIEDATGVKTYIDNDANIAALGEVVAGAAREYSDAVMVTVGTGVGAGIIIDNKIFNGCNGAAGEIGHDVIVVDGIECACGRRGCFEKYASATALIRMTREAMETDKKTLMWQLCDGNIENVSGKTAFDARRAGDGAGTRVVDVFAKYLATGIVNIVNVFQPQAVIIG